MILVTPVVLQSEVGSVSMQTENIRYNGAEVRLFPGPGQAQVNGNHTRGSVEAWLLVAPAEDDKEDGFCS